MITLTLSCAAVVGLLLLGLLFSIPAILLLIGLLAAGVSLLVKALLLPFRLLNYLPVAVVILLILFLF